MGTIGIDYQRNVCMVSISQSVLGTGVEPSSVTDGFRTLIPIRVGIDGSIGSKVLIDCPPDTLEWGVTDSSEPFCTSPKSDLFWQGLYRRIFAHLGQVEPSSRNGYGVILSPAASKVEVRLQVKQMCMNAGFSVAKIVSPTEAVASRWLSLLVNPLSPGKVRVCSVMVGDVSSFVEMIEVRTDLHGRNSLSSLAEPANIPYGIGHWVGRLTNSANERARSNPSFEYASSIQTHLVELGYALSTGDPFRPVAWDGPWTSSNHTPIQLMVGDIQALPGLANLTVAMMEKVRLFLMNDKSCNIILLGGIGSSWPGIAEKLRVLAPVWTSNDCTKDVAHGAAVIEQYIQRSSRPENVPPNHASKSQNLGTETASKTPSFLESKDDDDIQFLARPPGYT